jgi:peptide/nickel transport system substrate-binding protein
MKAKFVWSAPFSVVLAVIVLAGCDTPGATTAPVTTTTTQTTTTSITTTTTTAPPTTPASQAPKYGGVLRLSLPTDLTQSWDSVVTSTAVPNAVYGLTNEPIWWGDWTKGPAGGFGTNDTDWGGHFDLWPLMEGRSAEKWSWTVDANDTGKIVYTVRQGVNFGLNSASEASKLVNGRQMTADDVLFSLKQVAQDPRAYVAKSNPGLKAAVFEKTGPWEVTITLPVADMVTAIARLGMYGRVEPPEVIQRYGSMADWRNNVGTGPFMITDFVSGSVAVLKKNANYYLKDPVGPGKGNQLPYIDEIRYLIIPDGSTREAAMRTGKIDQWGITGEQWEIAETLLGDTPDLLSAEGTIPHGGEIQLRTDMKPFDNVKVRHAIMMATDFNAIHEGMNEGVGQIETWPFPKVKGYENLYVSNSDPDVPQIVRDIYTYNPDKAKALLAEAGYPNGFAITALVNSGVAGEVDYYSILEDMWSKVGIKLTLDVKEAGVVANIQRAHKQPEATIYGGSPVAIFYIPPTLYGTGANMSELNDSVILEALSKMRRNAVTDLNLAMKDMRELSIYLREQAYHIPRAKRPPVNLWWPWLKNYSGESFVSYGTVASWSPWVWLDQDLKRSMGY